jgi:hypothetical protein
VGPTQGDACAFTILFNFDDQKGSNVVVLYLQKRIGFSFATPMILISAIVALYALFLNASGATPTCDLMYAGGSCHTWGANDPIYSGYCCTLENNSPSPVEEGDNPNAYSPYQCGTLLYVQGGQCGAQVTTEGSDCGGAGASPSCD